MNLKLDSKILEETTDLNNITSSGCIRTGKYDASKVLNMVSGIKQCIVLTLHTSNQASYKQILFDGETDNVYYRSKPYGTNTSWSPWKNTLPVNISGKSNTSGTADIAKSVDWNNITGKPTIIDATEYNKHVNAYNMLNNKFNNLKSILRSYLNVKHPSAKAAIGYGVLSNGWGYMNSDVSVATLRGLIMNSPAGKTYSANTAVKVATISEAYPNTNFSFDSANAIGYQQGSSYIVTFTVSATRASNTSIDIYLTCNSDYPYQQPLVIYFNDLGWLTSATNIITSN